MLNKQIILTVRELKLVKKPTVITVMPTATMVGKKAGNLNRDKIHPFTCFRLYKLRGVVK